MRQSSNKNRLMVIIQYIILGILGTVAFYFSKPQFLFFFYNIFHYRFNIINTKLSPKKKINHMYYRKKFL